MDESNVFFATNTYNYGGFYTGETKNRFNEKKGNIEFFHQVMDYNALMKLRDNPQMGGSMTSDYYIGTRNQLNILDPNFSSIMVSYRK